jgi:benzoate membrane transport protein
MGVTAIALGLRSRLPISIAWSTPGAALLASSAHIHYGYAAALGAFLVGGALTVAAALARPFGRVIAAIPVAVGSAMLAGVLLSLCVAPVRALADLPQYAAPVVATWIVVDRFARRWAVPAALAAAAVAIAVSRSLHPALVAVRGPALAWTTPQFTLGAIVGLAIPLFVVTMAAQNIPGMAVLRSFGYRPRLRGPLLGTGAATVAGAPFGAHAVNLAAITAALVAGPDAHPDPARRWIASVSAGATYVALGLGAGVITAFASLSPPLLLEAVAGLALLRTLGGALADSLADAERREAAVITFVVAASGITVAGIGAPFWALVAGIAVVGGQARGSRARGGS